MAPVPLWSCTARGAADVGKHPLGFPQDLDEENALYSPSDSEPLDLTSPIAGDDQKGTQHKILSINPWNGLK